MANKKERDRLKRKRKQMEARRRANRSRYDILADQRLPVRCYANPNWKEDGILELVMRKEMPDGGLAMGVFLVDLWCCGLKDAWGRLDMSGVEFRDVLLRMKEGLSAQPASLDPQTARNLVAGGIAFAQKNGFRLPYHFDRWVAMLAPMPEEPDMSDFGWEGGKLHYVGLVSDLRRRLIGSMDEFLSRPDVHYTFRTAGDEMLDGEDELEDLDEPDEEDLAAFDAAVAGSAHRLLEKIRQWCAERGLTPEPALETTLQSFLKASIMACAADADADPKETKEQIAEAWSTLLESEHVDVEQFIPASRQIQEFLSSFSEPEALLECMGREPDESGDVPPTEALDRQEHS